jgi:hypothetical protein
MIMDEKIHTFDQVIIDNEYKMTEEDRNVLYSIAKKIVQDVESRNIRVDSDELGDGTQKVGYYNVPSKSLVVLHKKFSLSMSNFYWMGFGASLSIGFENGVTATLTEKQEVSEDQDSYRARCHDFFDLYNRLRAVYVYQREDNNNIPLSDDLNDILDAFNNKYVNGVQLEKEPEILVELNEKRRLKILADRQSINS